MHSINFKCTEKNCSAFEYGDYHNFRCFTSYRSYIFDFLILNSLIGALNLFKHEILFGESKKSEIILQSKQLTKKRHMQCKL